MIVRFKDSVTDKDADSHSVTIPKVQMARLVDYFMFNTDHNPYFDGTGQFEGIDGVATEITDVLKTFLDIEMDEHDWRALLRNEAPSLLKEMNKTV